MTFDAKIEYWLVKLSPSSNKSLASSPLSRLRRHAGTGGTAAALKAIHVTKVTAVHVDVIMKVAVFRNTLPPVPELKRKRAICC